MYRTTLNFHKAIERGENPVPYIVITTDMGYRAYAEKELGQVFELSGNFADGSVTADGSETAGSGAGVLEKSARVLRFGSLARSIQPNREGLLYGYTAKDQQYMEITLNNADYHFSRLIPKEPFITKTLVHYLGFESLDFYEHLKLFEGQITEVRITQDELILEAEER